MSGMAGFSGCVGRLADEDPTTISLVTFITLIVFKHVYEWSSKLNQCAFMCRCLCHDRLCRTGFMSDLVNSEI
jgi:hypothetical protein